MALMTALMDLMKQTVAVRWYC